MRIPRHARRHIVQMVEAAARFDRLVEFLANGAESTEAAVNAGADKLEVERQLAVLAYQFGRECLEARDWRHPR